MLDSWKAKASLRIRPWILKDLEKRTAFMGVANMIARHIQATRHLEWIHLRQEALRVIKDLRSAKYLVPLFVLDTICRTHLWDRTSFWWNADYRLLHALEDTAIENELPPGGRKLHLADDAMTTNGHAISRFNPPDSSIRATTATAQAASAEILSHTVGLQNGTATSSAYNQSPALARDNYIEFIRQLLSDDRANNRFSPTMDTPSSPSPLSPPQTPQVSRMSPSPRPDQGGSATVPSSVLTGHLDFSGSPHLFGLSQSPIPPSPSFASGSSPRS
jgi:hypothetical protein